MNIMDKKYYQKPAMRVVSLHDQIHLLAGSIPEVKRIETNSEDDDEKILFGGGGDGTDIYTPR